MYFISLVFPSICTCIALAIELEPLPEPAEA